MAATWTYSDWITQPYGATRLSRLRLHIQEVSEKVSEEMAADGQSSSSNAVEKYLESLRKTEVEEARLCGGAPTAAGVTGRALHVNVSGFRE